MKDCNILIANTPMDFDKIKIFGARVKVSSYAEVAEIEKAEKEKMKQKVNKILKYKPNVFINRQLIYDYPEMLFGDAGVMSIEHAEFDGIERLALCLDGEIVSTFNEPTVKLGHCDHIEEIMIGEDKCIRFSGVARGEACTVVLRGASKHILDEAERSLHDAFCVLSKVVNSKKTVLGAGCSEMLMAKAVDELALTVHGKEAMAIASFAEALRQIPYIIASNGGYDAVDLIAKLKSDHYQGNSTSGLDMNKGTVGDVRELGITESLEVKLQGLVSAHEAAEMIMRVDEIIRCAPRKRQPEA
jgi:T-complex protein 1 subunit beta